MGDRVLGMLDGLRHLSRSAQGTNGPGKSGFVHRAQSVRRRRLTVLGEHQSRKLFVQRIDDVAETAVHSRCEHVDLRQRE